jgi:23S rRNA-/tRNA-specific pseudouridylate synthase
LLAKTSKDVTRTGNAFRKHAVQKEYFCVVEGNLEEMMHHSERIAKDNGNNMFKLSGVFKANKTKSGVKPSKVGTSVLFKPLQNLNDSSNLGDQRVCHLEWEHLLTISKGIHLVRVITDTGAKHQVRAMLSQLAHSPVCGDLRYGASAALPDMSVALHARSLYLPTVSLGDVNMENMRFIAPIPKTWARFFSLKESNLPPINYT